MDGFRPNWMDRVRGAYHNSSLMRSGFVTALSLALLLAVIFGAWYEHVQGNFHRARTVPYVPDNVVPPRPGGLDLIRLTHEPVASTMTPEFSTVTLAPGLGMQVLQATISMPAHGDVPIMLGTGNDAKGGVTDRSTGAPIVVTVSDRNSKGSPVHVLTGQADHVTYRALPDGGGADASFGSTANGIETTVSSTLGGHALDLVVTARNQSTQPRAVTISWQPRFLLTARGTTLIPPRLEDANPPPITVGLRDVKEEYRRFKRSYLNDDGPEARIRNDADGYAIGLKATNQNVRSLNVESAKGSGSVLLEFSTDENKDTPTILQPGDSLRFSVRVEITAITGSSL
jgi:hypothetical protein